MSKDTAIKLAVLIRIEVSYGVKTIRIVPMKREADYVLNCTYSSYDSDKERAVGDLQLISYFGDNGRTYGLEPCYSNVFSVDARRAAIMARTLARIEKAINAAESQEPGDVFMAFCKAIGATEYAIKTRGGGSNLREMGWRFDTIAAGRNELRRMLEREALEAINRALLAQCLTTGNGRQLVGSWRVQTGRHGVW